MKQIKSEPVFGDQSLFNGMPESDVAVVEYNNVRVSYSTYDSMLDHLLFRNNVTVDSIPIVAIRRIIPEPVWTWTDKEEGRLPEVGAVCEDKWFIFSVISVTERYMVLEEVVSKQVIALLHSSFMASCVPTETPEEKYERECSELARNKNNKIGLSFDCGVEIYKELKPFKENR